MTVRAKRKLLREQARMVRLQRQAMESQVLPWWRQRTIGAAIASLLTRR